MNIHRIEDIVNESGRMDSLWYTKPLPRVPRGWLVYTLDFVLATLQGCVTEPEKVRRSALWLVIGAFVRSGMAVVQLLIMVLAWIPVLSSFLEVLTRVFSRNAVGFFLRACYWKAKLKYLGQDTIIDQYVDIWGASSVIIGSRCHIDTNVRLAAGEQRHGQHGRIEIGNYVHLGPGVHIAGRGRVEIHDMVGISSNAHIYSATNTVESPSDPGQLISMSHVSPHGHQHIVEGPVVIEEYAFVGMMSRIMPNVRVGRGAIVHANAELTQNVPPFANVGAIPRGRQIGWRKPRRPSPHLAPTIALPSEVTAVSVPGEPSIREVVDPNDWTAIEGVARLHFEAFGAGVTTQLGKTFVRNYYTAIVTEKNCSLWVAELDGQVVGFLGGTIDRHHFERKNRSGVTRLLAVWRFVTLRLSPYAVLRALKKKQLSRHYEAKAELLSIVVSPTARRSGLGKRFLQAWSETLRAAAIPCFIVFTDNPEGLNFYEKYGGNCLFKFQLRKLWSACFRFDIRIEKGSESPDVRQEETVDAS